MVEGLGGGYETDPILRVGPGVEEALMRARREMLKENPGRRWKPGVLTGKESSMRVVLTLLAWLAGPALLAGAQEPARPFGYGTLPRGAWACLGSPRFVSDN